MAAIVSDDPVVFWQLCGKDATLAASPSAASVPERLKGEIPGRSQQQHTGHIFLHSKLTGEHQDQIPLKISEAAAERT